jgi:hypothetical protein
MGKVIATLEKGFGSLEKAIKHHVERNLQLAIHVTHALNKKKQKNF